jgi:hypothetical protein
MASMSYAVVWRENGGVSYAGQLALDGDCIVLSGTASGARESERRLLFDDLVDSRLERSGAPKLVLIGPSENRVEIASLEGTGALHELAEQLALMRGKAAS